MGKLRGILASLMGAGAALGLQAPDANAQQEAFGSTSEAQAYLEANPNGPLADQAFRVLILENLRSVDPTYDNLPATQRLDRSLGSETGPNLNAPASATAGSVGQTPLDTANDVFAQSPGGRDDSDRSNDAY